LLDGMYLQNTINALGVYGTIDYQKLSDKLVHPDQRARTYVFDALPNSSPQREQKQKFLDRLRYLDNFQVDEGSVRQEVRVCPHCDKDVVLYRQKKVDVLIATRLLEVSFDGKTEKIVLIAGDADFVPAVQIAKQNVEVVLAYGEFGNVGVATDLKKACDKRILLDRGYLESCKFMIA
jgi:uncharacterized LabA/DUF88 family protein